MAQLRLDLPDNIHKALQKKVGYGNVSQVIRNYIQHIITAKEEDDVFLLQKRLELVKEQKEKIDHEFFDIKAKIEGIEERERLTEIKRLKDQEKEDKEKLRQAKLINDAIGASGITEIIAEKIL